MPDKLLLVAEQDEAGRVIAVWKRTKSDRVARPMARNDLDKEALSRAAFHGASPQEIAHFIASLPRP